ncbi:hypothetical protein CUMW_229380 [Citrus unshiu]|uniref:Cation/H+ exchanger domain-containing protein n=1 Tax=Citrus unshiu TaxID=55188 RepID=A0A2H5QH38_CITUN|nr:hypothetical protein CUMW_229380 [Citrus unshiu]
MERQMETLATILNELRDERRRDREIPVGRDDVGAEPNIRRHRVEEIPPPADQPYGVHPHRSTGWIPGEQVDEGRNQPRPRQVPGADGRGVNADEGELRQRLQNAEQERDQIAARDPDRAIQLVDARFRFSSFYDQDPCSINFTTTRRSPSNASSPDVPAHTDKSEYAGCSPGANPPTLKELASRMTTSWTSRIFLLLFLRVPGFYGTHRFAELCHQISARHSWSRRHIYPKQYLSQTTCTIIVVLFSTVLFGSITKPLIEAVLLRHTKTLDTDATHMQSLEDLRILLLENGENTDPGSNQQAVPRASGLRLLISYPTTVHYFWRKVDVKFMRPVFGGRGLVPFVPSSPTDAVDEAS